MFTLRDDDDDLFDFDNENFLQDVLKVNKKGNEAAECLESESPTKQLISKAALPEKSTLRDNTCSTSFLKNICKLSSDIHSPTVLFKEHPSVSSYSDVLHTDKETTQNASSRIFYNQSNGQTTQDIRPSHSSPLKITTTFKRKSLDTVESPVTPLVENNQFLSRNGNGMLTLSKSGFSNSNNSTPVKRNKRLSEMLGLNDQSSGAILENKSWKNMLSESDIFSNVLEQFNIAWALKMHSFDMLPNEKVPLLIVSVKMINQRLKGSHFVTLQDKTGEVNGDIHWGNSSFEKVQPGDVLLIRHVTFFTPHSKTKNSLIIVPDNIICVWPTNELEDRYCSFTKQHLAAKVRLWLKESGLTRPTVTASNDEMHQTKPINISQTGSQMISTTSSSHNISVPTEGNISEDEFLWEDDKFEEIILQEEFDEMFKDDDKFLAELEF